MALRTNELRRALSPVNNALVGWSRDAFVMRSSIHTPLRDGSSVEIRQLEPDEGELLARGFQRLSEDGRYRRFGTSAPELSESQLRQLTDVDHRDHER